MFRPRKAGLQHQAEQQAWRARDCEGRIGDAYLIGDIDIEGDMLRPFELRQSMGDFHLATAAWRFIQPLLFGQVHTNRRAITAHYDIDPEFFLSFLDRKTPCYTQGVYLNANETLDVATFRTKRSTSPRCENSTTASSSAGSGLATTCLKSGRAGVLGSNMHRREGSSAQESPSRKYRSNT